MSTAEPRVAREFMEWAEESGHAAMIRDKYRQTVPNPGKGWGLGLFERLHIGDLLVAAWEDCGSNNKVVARREEEQASKVRDWQEPLLPSWSPEWPTEPGWYWFYGWEFGASTSVEAALDTVEVFASGGALVYIRSGHALRKEKGATGLWLPLETPEVPEEVKM